MRAARTVWIVQRAGVDLMALRSVVERRIMLRASRLGVGKVVMLQ